MSSRVSQNPVRQEHEAQQSNITLTTAQNPVRQEHEAQQSNITLTTAQASSSATAQMTSMPISGWSNLRPSTVQYPVIMQSQLMLSNTTPIAMPVISTTPSAPTAFAGPLISSGCSNYFDANANEPSRRQSATSASTVNGLGLNIGSGTPVSEGKKIYGFAVHDLLADNNSAECSQKIISTKVQSGTPETRSGILNPSEWEHQDSEASEDDGVKASVSQEHVTSAIKTTRLFASDGHTTLEQ
ncbi:hypothetical protein Tcan_18282 [Toxocara canis]|uniref:Uncharacterized protein n=1 Tax=Toxocara canis TaxID=6265 RepID=A0A0B2V993_TOXCA|nr:hypothetical protein Tcan_18282 [Toxocara canis]